MQTNILFYTNNKYTKLYFLKYVCKITEQRKV